LNETDIVRGETDNGDGRRLYGDRHPQLSLRRPPKALGRDLIDKVGIAARRIWLSPVNSGSGDMHRNWKATFARNLPCHKPSKAYGFRFHREIRPLGSFSLSGTIENERSIFLESDISTASPGWPKTTVRSPYISRATKSHPDVDRKKAAIASPPPASRISIRTPGAP
jgi:hypothetical protein